MRETAKNPAHDRFMKYSLDDTDSAARVLSAQTKTGQETYA